MNQSKFVLGYWQPSQCGMEGKRLSGRKKGTQRKRKEQIKRWRNKERGKIMRWRERGKD